MPSIPIPLKRKPDNTPGGLAIELGSAKITAEAEIAAAREKLARVRDNVIERGTQRIADLRQLEEEARTERQLVEQVINKA